MTVPSDSTGEVEPDLDDSEETGSDDIDPYVGTWRTMDQDGGEVVIDLAKASDGSYTYSRTDEHLRICEAFGAPVGGVTSGSAESDSQGLRFVYERITCRTDWGDVAMDVHEEEVLRLEDGVLVSALPLCYRQGPPEPCDGVDRPEVTTAEPDIAALVAEYGYEWVRDNYQGDLADIGFAQVAQPFSMGVCWPPPGSAPPDLSGYRLHEEPVGDLPRDPVAGPDETTWIYQRRTDSVKVFDQRQLPAGQGQFEGAGMPRSDGELMVFHTFGVVSFTRSASGPVTGILSLEDTDGQLATDDNGDVVDWIADAYPVGDEILVARRTGYYRYDLDGNEVWKWNHGGHLGSLVPGDGFFWGADREGNLFRIPFDGSDGVIYPIPDAVWDHVGNRALRPTPRVLPVAGGVWVTNADDTMVFIANDGVASEPVVVGSPPRGDGSHVEPVRSVKCGGGYLWIETGDGSQRIRLDNPTVVEQWDAEPLLLTPGVEWRTGASELFAIDIETRAELGRWELPDSQQGLWVTWAHDSLWISYQEGISYQLRPGS